jgi:dolichol-phosphate mannosyltransferase
MLSVIVPTFNEGSNVDRMYEAVTAAFPRGDFELLFVDDSTDGTRDRIARLAAADPHVRLLAGEGRRGLARAVADGVGAAKGDVLAVLDGDLQHPPGLLPYLVRVLEEENADLVVPSRYVAGGSPGGLGPLRKVISLGAKFLAQAVLKEARRTSDPLGGFFVVRRRALEGVTLAPRGWKILLEVLVRGRIAKVVDVPYRFAPRTEGESKLSWRVELEFLHHLLDLFLASPESQRFWLFAMVGGSGVLVNAVAFSFFLHLGDASDHLWVVIASLLASHVAMLNNFFWNYQYTWRDQRHRSLAVHLFRYWVVSELGSAVTALIATLLMSRLHSDLVAQMTGVVVAVVVTYQLTNRWVFARPGLKRWQPARQR